MSNTSVPTLYRAVSKNLATQRLIWATKPMGFLFVVLWVLHPTTTSHVDLVHTALLGFLVGIFYGLVVYGAKLYDYIASVNSNQRFKPNRVPEEYYWGNILQTMFDNR